MKLMKKLSVCVFALFLAITSASAYEQDITLDKNDIELSYVESANTPYVAVKGTLKNSEAKVYLQEVQVTKEQFDKIVQVGAESEKYYDDNIAKMDTATNEEKEAFNNKTQEYRSTLKSLVPTYVDSDWRQLELTSSTDSENRYAANVSGKNAYFVSWVKVTIGNAEYYNYSVNCLDETPEPVVNICKVVDGKYYGKDGKEVTKEQYTDQCEKKICRIVGGKYYDKNGKEVSKAAYYKACPNPKTGRNTYYTYGILTVAGAFILYMFVRRIKKFSN